MLGFNPIIFKNKKRAIKDHRRMNSHQWSNENYRGSLYLYRGFSIYVNALNFLAEKKIVYNRISFLFKSLFMFFNFSTQKWHKFSKNFIFLHHLIVCFFFFRETMLKMALGWWIYRKLMFVKKLWAEQCNIFGSYESCLTERPLTLWQNGYNSL